MKEIENSSINTHKNDITSFIKPFSLIFLIPFTSEQEEKLTINFSLCDSP